MEDRWWLVVEDDVISDLAIQYADFGYWQQQWLQGEVLSEQVKYWKEKLKHDDGDIPSLQLPTDHSRPAIQTFNGGSSILKELSSTVCHQLQALCHGGDVTMFMTLLAAFQILLYRYSGGQEHFAIGSPIANRNRMEIEGLIGFFVNTLVLKSDVSGANLTFKQVLFNGVRKTCLEAFQYQDMPFDKLVEELNPARHLGQTPLFQVMFVLQQDHQHQHQHQQEQQEQQEQQQRRRRRQHLGQHQEAVKSVRQESTTESNNNGGAALPPTRTLKQQSSESNNNGGAAAAALAPTRTKMGRRGEMGIKWILQQLSLI